MTKTSKEVEAELLGPTYRLAVKEFTEYNRAFLSDPLKGLSEGDLNEFVADRDGECGYIVLPKKLEDMIPPALRYFAFNGSEFWDGIIRGISEALNEHGLIVDDSICPDCILYHVGEFGVVWESGDIGEDAWSVAIPMPSHKKTVYVDFKGGPSAEQAAKAINECDGHDCLYMVEETSGGSYKIRRDIMALVN